MTDLTARLQPFLALDRHMLSELLRPSIPNPSIVAATPLNDSRMNTNYKLQLANLVEPVVLRIYTHDPQSCRKEVDVYNLVHDRIPVPEIFYADTEGKTFGVTYSISRWVEGIKLQQLYDTATAADRLAAARVAGEILAALSAYHFPHAGQFGPNLSIPNPFDPPTQSIRAYALQCLEAPLVQERLGMSLIETIQRHFDDHSAIFQTLGPHAILVHGDYIASNLLVREDKDVWRMAAVLDWEFSHAGFAIFDLGRHLRMDPVLTSPIAEHFIRGYEAQNGKLPQHWKQAAKLYDLMLLCDLLLYPALEKEHVSSVITLMATTIERWLELA